MEYKEENIENLCYTSNVGRQHFDYRIGVSGKNATQELEKKLDQYNEKVSSTENDQIENGNRNGNGITQNLEVYIEIKDITKIPGKLYSIIDDLCSTKKIFKESFESCIQQVEDRLTLKKVIQEKKETVEILQGQVLVLSFYYSLQKLNEFLILKDNGSKTTYAGYGFGELIGLVN